MKNVKLHLININKAETERGEAYIFWTLRVNSIVSDSVNAHTGVETDLVSSAERALTSTFETMQSSTHSNTEWEDNTSNNPQNITYIHFIYFCLNI